MGLTNPAEAQLVERVRDIYDRICKLESLKPCKAVNGAFTELVGVCTPPSSIDVRSLREDEQEMRSRLIALCGEAEGLLEGHYAALLARFSHPLHHLFMFPYYNNYRKLALLEFNVLRDNRVPLPVKTLAFVGSGPLPLTSIVLALHHMPSTSFHNYDVDPAANSMARSLVRSHPDLSRRMTFHTSNILHATHALARYDVVFLAALVGLDGQKKSQVLSHLHKHMAPGALLLLRSAHGARGFLYPVVDLQHDLRGFQLISVVHPTDDVINSVVLARKCEGTTIRPPQCNEQRDPPPLPY